MLSRQEQEYLCDGFIRNNYYYSTPFAINKLIHKFWNDVRSWIFKGNLLNKFLQSQPSNELCHKEFKIKNIPLIAKIYPNGTDYTRRGSVIFRIHFNCPLYVESIQMYTEIYCPQTHSHFRYCEELKTKNGYIGWTKTYLQLKQCKNIDKNKLEFLYFVDVKSIKYNQILMQKNNFYTPTKLNKNICYEWNINKSQLNLFKNYISYQYAFSKLFGNNCWSLWCAPKGFGKYKGFVIGIELYYLPHYLKHVDGNVTIKIEPNIYKENKLKKISCFGKGYYIEFGTQLSIEHIIRQSINKDGISITCDICCLNVS
eukprot:2816_1